MSSWSIAAPKNEAFGRGLVRVIVLFGKHSVKHLFKNYFRELICQVKINIYHRIARTDVIVNQGLFNICFRQDKWWIALQYIFLKVIHNFICITKSKLTKYCMIYISRTYSQPCKQRPVREKPKELASLHRLQFYWNCMLLSQCRFVKHMPICTERWPF